MGITGLLPFLKSIQKDTHVSSFKGMKVGVDTYCWLHKGVYSCSAEIVMKTAKIETLPFINYCLRRVNLLRQYDVTPVMVFDGDHLPSKARTEKERRDKRKVYLTKGKELLKLGKKSEARECFQKCVDVSPEMALAFIKECRKLGVECIVAPYEADAQLAYLSKEGVVDLVISEDSDLLVFGSPKVFFKMDESGYGKLIELKDLGKANNILVGFTPTSFRHMCIFSGCDYLQSVHGVGLVKAAKLLRKHNHNPQQAIRSLRCDSSNVPDDYEENFKKADETYLYQLVYDPRTCQQVRLHPMPAEVSTEQLKFAGVEHSPRKAVLMARGNINPITKEVLDNYSPSKALVKSRSWSCSAMGNTSQAYPVATQAKLPMLCSERSTRQFKAPSSVQTFRSQQVVEERVEKEEDILGMYAGSSANQSHQAGKKGLLQLYSFGKGNKGEEAENSQDVSSSSGNVQRVTRSRFFAHEVADNNAGSESEDSVNEKDSSPTKQAMSRSLSSNVDDSSDHSEDSRPLKRKLFNNGRLNTFAFSKRKHFLNESVDSGVEMSQAWNSSQSSMGSTSGTSHSFSQKDPLVGGAANENTAVDSLAVKSVSVASRALLPRKHNELHQCRKVDLLPVASPKSTALICTKEEEEKLQKDENEFKEDSSRTLIKSFKDRLPAKKLGDRRLTLPCTKSRRVGLSKRVNPPRLSDPGPKQMQLNAFAYIKKPRMQL